MIAVVKVAVDARELIVWRNFRVLVSDKQKHRHRTSDEENVFYFHFQFRVGCDGIVIGIAVVDVDVHVHVHVHVRVHVHIHIRFISRLVAQNIPRNHAPQTVTKQADLQVLAPAVPPYSFIDKVQLRSDQIDDYVVKLRRAKRRKNS